MTDAGDFDVLIVGGGPAGSSCAWKLHRAGLKVLVLDKAVFPRDKPCAGWITPQIIEELELDVDHYRKDRVWQPIWGFRCGVMGGADIEVRYNRPISFGIRRCQFDTYLLERSGAVCQLGEPVRQMERQNGIWTVNGQWRAPMLVGAGGHFCPVARWLGARQGTQRRSSLVTAQEVEFVADREPTSFSTVAPELPELYFCRDLLGYGWCFRKENYFNVGLGRLESHQLSEHVAQFCQFLHDRGKLTDGALGPFRGHAYLLYEGQPRQLYADGVVLVGDAAGMAYRHSGEGIRPAVETGLMAAACIVACQGDYRAERLRPYEDRVTQRFGRPGKRAKSWLPQSWLASLGSWLLTQRWFAKHIVMDRWFLHADQAPLVMD